MRTAHTSSLSIRSSKIDHFLGCVSIADANNFEGKTVCGHPVPVHTLLLRFRPDFVLRIGICHSVQTPNFHSRHSVQY